MPRILVETARRTVFHLTEFNGWNRFGVLKEIRSSIQNMITKRMCKQRKEAQGLSPGHTNIQRLGVEEGPMEIKK